MDNRDCADGAVTLVNGIQVAAIVYAIDADIVAVLVGCQQKLSIRCQIEVPGNLAATADLTVEREQPVPPNLEYHDLIRTPHRYIEPLFGRVETNRRAKYAREILRSITNLHQFGLSSAGLICVDVDLGGHLRHHIEPCAVLTEYTVTDALAGLA